MQTVTTVMTGMKNLMEGQIPILLHFDWLAFAILFSCFKKKKKELSEADIY